MGWSLSFYAATISRFKFCTVLVPGLYSVDEALALCQQLTGLLYLLWLRTRATKPATDDASLDDELSVHDHQTTTSQRIPHWFGALQRARLSDGCCGSTTDENCVGRRPRARSRSTLRSGPDRRALKGAKLVSGSPSH